jgi:carbamate kinase
MSEPLEETRYRNLLQTAKNKIEASAFRREKMFVAVDAIIKIGQKQGKAALIDTLKEINDLIAEGLGRPTEGEN